MQFCFCFNFNTLPELEEAFEDLYLGERQTMFIKELEDMERKLEESQRAFTIELAEIQKEFKERREMRRLEGAATATASNAPPPPPPLAPQAAAEAAGRRIRGG